MRWLEKSYAKVLQNFKETLKSEFSLSEQEIGICLELATNDLSGTSIFATLASPN
jgi:hypothetical protein